MAWCKRKEELRLAWCERPQVSAPLIRSPSGARQLTAAYSSCGRGARRPRTVGGTGSRSALPASGANVARSSSIRLSACPPFQTRSSSFSEARSHRPQVARAASRSRATHSHHFGNGRNRPSGTRMIRMSDRNLRRGSTSRSSSRTTWSAIVFSYASGGRGGPKGAGGAVDPCADDWVTVDWRSLARKGSCFEMASVIERNAEKTRGFVSSRRTVQQGVRRVSPAQSLNAENCIEVLTLYRQVLHRLDKYPPIRACRRWQVLVGVREELDVGGKMRDHADVCKRAGGAATPGEVLRKSAH